MVPISSVNDPLGIWDALFIATSATCVTGLSTISVGARAIYFWATCCFSFNSNWWTRNYDALQFDDDSVGKEHGNEGQNYSTRLAWGFFIRRYLCHDFRYYSLHSYY